MTSTGRNHTNRHNLLRQRAQIIRQIRKFFDTRNFLEIETPHRIPANAPEPHIDAVPSGDWSLQTSPELAMKRLIAEGLGDIYQLCRAWRQGERGRLHLPEFTLLEWYRSGGDYRALMDDCEALFAALAPQGTLTWQGLQIDLTGPWARMSLSDAFSRYASFDLTKAVRDDCFETVLTEQVEPHLGINKPTFITDYPIEMAALACRNAENPDHAERFELYIAGLEVANAYTELTDPHEQRQRFVRDEQYRRSLGKQANPLPEKFLADLADMPPTAGIALGVDRLVMLLTDQADISSVVAFPPEEL